MPQPFDSVRETLLRAGIAPRHARRYVAELRDHLADLTAEGRAEGYDQAAAAARARGKLGSDAELAQAMLDRPGFRSLATRAPWAVFGIAPVLLGFVLVMLMARLLMGLTWPYRDNLAAMPSGIASTVSALMFAGNYLAGPLMAGIWVLLAVRQRSASAWVWLALALTALLFGVFGTHGGDGHPYRVAHLTLVVVGLRSAAILAAAAIAYRYLLNRAAAATPAIS